MEVHEGVNDIESSALVKAEFCCYFAYSKRSSRFRHEAENAETLVDSRDPFEATVDRAAHYWFS